MANGSKETPHFAEKTGNHDQRTQILSGQLITSAIPVGDLSLYQRAGLDTGYKILSIAEAGKTYLFGKRKYVTEPGKNGVPNLVIKVNIETLHVDEGRLAISIERPRDRVGFKMLNRRLMLLREQKRKQSSS